MKRFIEVTRFGTGVIPKGVMLDHLGAQLAVMGHILLQSPILQSSATEDRMSFYQLTCDFFDSHLLWSTGLLEAAEQRANTDFYRSSIRVTREFLQSEAQSPFGSRDPSQR
jgi:TorA maturation chaperone TorD